MSQRPSLIRRAVIQMDLAFWYLHAHFAQLAILALPTLIAVFAIAIVVATIIQTWELPGVLAYVLFAIVLPTLAMWVAVFAPLPSAVFAWRRANGTLPETRECFAFCWQRGGRLTRVGVRLFFSYLWWFILFGIPLLFLWSRTCAAPAVALFEDDPRIFQRSRRLLKEETAIHLLAALYFAVFVALALFLFLPRIALSIPSQILATSTSRWLTDHLWIPEMFGSGILVSIMAVGWCISMTLLYRDIRFMREGEILRERIDEVRDELLGASPLESRIQA
jgi:hypothetical protein